MKSRFVRSMLGLGLVVSVSGCAVGQKISYHNVDLDLSASGSGSVAVAALDHRPYVKNGEKETTYTGNLRGGFGNPFNLNTDSGKPLADDMASVVCSSLKKKGFGCTTVSVDPKDSADQAAGKLQATKADKLLLLSVNEWYSSTYQNTGLTYDVLLDVMNSAGAKLAEKGLKGEDDLGGSFWSPPAHAKEAVPAAFKAKMETLLNDPAVAGALK